VPFCVINRYIGNLPQVPAHRHGLAGLFPPSEQHCGGWRFEHRGSHSRLVGAEEQTLALPVLARHVENLEGVMAKEKELKDLFLDTLKDIYFAEKKILSALPKMAKAAQSPKLKAAFEKHLEETEGQVDRLDQVFASIDEAPKGKTCDAIMGIIDEGKEVMDEYKGMPALDAGLLAAAQAVEHYEISRYGTLRTWANELGYQDAVKLLDATLKEEKNTDSTLSQLAESEVNKHAETAQAA
jgi:ferritin-like metal-binding protein YciE